jgi:hypothetical protein
VALLSRLVDTSRGLDRPFQCFGLDNPYVKNKKFMARGRKEKNGKALH